MPAIKNPYNEYGEYADLGVDPTAISGPVSGGMKALLPVLANFLTKGPFSSTTLSNILNNPNILIKLLMKKLGDFPNPINLMDTPGLGAHGRTTARVGREPTITPGLRGEFLAADSPLALAHIDQGRSLMPEFKIGDPRSNIRIQMNPSAPIPEHTGLHEISHGAMDLLPQELSEPIARDSRQMFMNRPDRNLAEIGETLEMIGQYNPLHYPAESVARLISNRHYDPIASTVSQGDIDDLVWRIVQGLGQ